MIYEIETLKQIKKYLIAENCTVSVAESVTSGHLQAALSSVSDASKFYQGGITAYNAGQKCRHLDIEPIAALDNDCVTPEVASEMALKVNVLFISSYGISITGYATKVPEKDINELFAYCAIAHKQEILFNKKLLTNKAEGVEAQIDYANQILREFENILSKKNGNLR